MSECFTKWCRGAALMLLLWVLSPGAMAADLKLMMVTQPGCAWCARWKKEIGPAWPKTAEAARAPMFEQDLHADLPEGVTLARPPVYTPTFILLADGKEVDRVEGYAGRDFFWTMIDDLLAQAPEK